ncbi:uncharacterized protein LOC118182750 [Stegodyphus dumicola]|uniref:uncharacterized protein LOC118182750 n=1 Tax=Stegodyphus dumicola TaxID=202533 RepID=UPI0015AC62A2|nr:uncharacterized protein LOC118182750 [Stegodyphus dumicola]
MYYTVKNCIFTLCLVSILVSAHKYSTPVTKPPSSPAKVTHPPSSTNTHKKYVDFDLKSQSSRYGKGDPYFYQHYGPEHKSYYDHWYSHYGEHYPYYYSKSYDYHHMIPYVLAGLGMLLLPLLTLMLTLAVNIAPASNIPTAVTTATGKLLGSLNSTKVIGEIWDKLDSAISKYGKLNDL